MFLNPLFFPSFFLYFFHFFFFFHFFLPFFLSFISFILTFFLLRFFFSTLFLGDNLPPAGKLQNGGSTLHIVSSLLLKITLPSKTTSYSMNASRTSTAIRSKHQLERGTDLSVMKKQYLLYTKGSWRGKISVEPAKLSQQSLKSLINTGNRKLFAIRFNNFKHCRIIDNHLVYPGDMS